MANPTPDDVLAWLRDKKLVALLGAGLSEPIVGDWEALTSKLANACGIPAAERVGQSFPEIVDKCIDLGVSQCNDFLRKELQKHSQRVRSAMLHALRLPFVDILTTNFDPHLQTFAQRGDFQYRQIYPDLCLLERTNYQVAGTSGRGIFYLHGLFDSETPSACITDLVFGERSFRKAYESSSLRDCLLQYFTFRRILFIGVSLREPRMAELLRIAKQRRPRRQGVDSSTPWHMSLCGIKTPVDDEEKERVEHELAELAALDIAPVVYRVQSDNDHSALEELLHSWIESCDISKASPAISSGLDIYGPIEEFPK